MAKIMGFLRGSDVGRRFNSMSFVVILMFAAEAPNAVPKAHLALFHSPGPAEKAGMFTSHFRGNPTEKRENKKESQFVSIQNSSADIENMNMLKRCEAKLPKPSLQLLGWRVVAGRSRLGGAVGDVHQTQPPVNKTQLGKGWANLLKENGIFTTSQLRVSSTVPLLPTHFLRICLGRI